MFGLSAQKQSMLKLSFDFSLEVELSIHTCIYSSLYSLIHWVLTIFQVLADERE